MQSNITKSASRVFKLAACQLKTTTDKAVNLAKAGDLIRTAASNGAEVIVLPEIFCCPYTKEYMLKEKEMIVDDSPEKSGPAFNFLRDIAKETGKYIIGGSIPE